jgi:hypothetical protein
LCANAGINLQNSRVFWVIVFNQFPGDLRKRGCAAQIRAWRQTSQEMDTAMLFMGSQIRAGLVSALVL